MAAKIKTRYKYSPQTKALARYGRELSALLWQKAIASSTPEVREMLFVHARLNMKYADVLPEEQERPIRAITHGEILENVEKAREFLTGASPEIFNT